MADIKGLLMGKDCPHMKENKGKQNKVSSNDSHSFFPFYSFEWLIAFLPAGGAGLGVYHHLRCGGVQPELCRPVEE